MRKRDVFSDVTSGSKNAIERAGMKRLLDYAEDGDTVVVWRIDRLGRSLIDVLNTVNLLRGEDPFGLGRYRSGDVLGPDDAGYTRHPGRVRARTRH